MCIISCFSKFFDEIVTPPFSSIIIHGTSFDERSFQCSLYPTEKFMFSSAIIFIELKSFRQYNVFKGSLVPQLVKTIAHVQMKEYGRQVSDQVFYHPEYK